MVTVCHHVFIGVSVVALALEAPHVYDRPVCQSSIANFVPFRSMSSAPVLAVDYNSTNIHLCGYQRS